jgi:RNA polymerase sigma factor (sigma-70 family)
MSKCANEGCARPATTFLCAICGHENKATTKELRLADKAERKELLRSGEPSVPTDDDDWRSVVYSRAVLQRPYTVSPSDSTTWRGISKFKQNSLKVEPLEHYEGGLWPIEFRCAHVELKEAVDLVLTTLTPRESAVIQLRFGIGENTDYLQEEIARPLRVTRGRVHQIEAKALRKLRHPFRRNILLPFTSSSVPIEDIQAQQQRAYDYWGIDNDQLWEGTD